MQKKVIATLISGAFAGAAGVAYAGPISIASVTTYATEAIGATTQIANPAVAYSLTNPLAAPSSQTVRFSVDSGSLASCPTLAFTGTAGAALTIGAGALASNNTACDFSVAVATAPVPSNATLSFTGGTVVGATALSTSGGVVNVTVQVRDNGGNVVESNTGALARSANAWTATVTASSAFATPETRRIDVAANPPLTAFTANGIAVAGVVNLGRVRVAETTGQQFAGNGTTEVNFANSTTQTLSLTVTGTFQATTATFLSGASDCSTQLPGSTFTLNAGRTSGTVTGVDITGVTAGSSGKDVFVCYSDPVGATGVIPVSQFAISAGSYDATNAAPFTTATALSGGLYNLTLNGSQIDIRNYVPSNTSGWTSAYRIINTGAVAAAVTGQVILADGTLGATSALISSSINPGGVAVVSAAQIEAALGAITAVGGVGPRLRLTAPTDSLRVQAFACQPNGTCFLNSDAMGVDAGGVTQTNDAR